MPLPPTAHQNFRKLVGAYQGAVISFPHLKAVTAAQLGLESGWGGTGLAKQHRNYGGMKWRDYMAPWAGPAWYEAHDGRELYCSFRSDADFIDGFWARLDLNEAYDGWRDSADDADAFIEFIGPIWVGGSPANGRKYVGDIQNICAMRTADLFSEA